MNKIFETPLYPYNRAPDQDAPAPVRHPVIVVGRGPGRALPRRSTSPDAAFRSWCSTRTTR